MAVFFEWKNPSIYVASCLAVSEVDIPDSGSIFQEMDEQSWNVNREKRVP